MSTISKFIEKVETQGGATFDISNGNINFEEGFAVGKKGFEKKLTIKDVDIREEVIGYIEKNSLELSNEGSVLGAWVNDGNLYLDVSSVVIDKRKAITSAILNGQKAIYDFKNEKDINLPKPQTSGTLTQQASHLKQIVDRLLKE